MTRRELAALPIGTAVYYPREDCMGMIHNGFIQWNDGGFTHLSLTGRCCDDNDLGFTLSGRAKLNRETADV